MRYIIAAAVLAATVFAGAARGGKVRTYRCVPRSVFPTVERVVYDSVFADSTLRLDYIFGGNAQRPSVHLARTHYTGAWAGRRSRLADAALAGNASVTLTDAVTSDTLYRGTFSTLYNEWLSLGDTVCRAYEVTQLVPWPKRAVDITVDVRNPRHQVVARHRHRFSPSDILVQRPSRAPLDTVALHRGNFDGRRIQVMIVPEGFTQQEMPKFVDYARRTVEAIRGHEPFGEMMDRFDFTAVMAPSAESGVSVPKKGQWRDTAVGSHFSTFYSDRYLTTPNVFALHNLLAGLPYEHIIILANTNVYGGGGIYNSYTLTTTDNPHFEPVVVHEFGHSFGGLGDEYFYDNDVMTDTYPLDIEPWEPNITTLVNFGSKWKHIIGKNVPLPTPAADADKYPVGLYEGGGYAKKGIYRPADRCRMRVNDIDHFCPACIEALTRLIRFYTD